MFPDGEVERLGIGDVTPSYRAIEFDEHAIFLGGEVKAPRGDSERVNDEHMSRRLAKLKAQVYDQPTCGSTWKNPGGGCPSAWELVDRVGMRGARHGDAQVSEKHANFIVNLDEARAEDVVELMTEARRRVHEEYGIWLEPELHFWGFDSEVLQGLGVER